jgi:hypothetical protein
MKIPLTYRHYIILSGLVVVVLAGLFVAQKAMRGREAPGLPAAPKKETVTIFLPAREGHLVRKTTDTKESIPAREKADVIMRELRMGNAVPDKLTLHEFSLSGDGVLYLNLSQDIKSEKMNAASEITTVYAIIDSFLANFREARSVQILVDGQALHTINGVLYTYAPMELNNQLTEE